jgi:hypothetical protein
VRGCVSGLKVGVTSTLQIGSVQLAQTSRCLMSLYCFVRNCVVWMLFGVVPVFVEQKALRVMG